MEKSAVEQATDLVMETKQKAQDQINLDTRASHEILDKATATVKTINEVWKHAYGQLHDLLPDNPQMVAQIFEVFKGIQTAHVNTAYNGLQFIEMYNYHMNGQGDWDMGARYVIDDFVRGFLNHVPALPLEYLNIEDSGKQNPLYTFDPIPVEQLQADPENARIPVRIETLDRFLTGYIENFRFMKNVNGNPIQIITTAPAIRTKENYVTLNSIYRWYPITEELLKRDWEDGRWNRLKKASNPIEKASTPTEAQNE